MVSILGDGIEPHHPALEPNYVSVPEEDGRRPGFIPSQRPRIFWAELCFVGGGPKVWQSWPRLLVQTRKARSNQLRWTLKTHTGRPLGSHLVSLIQDQLASVHVSGRDGDGDASSL